jgi:hypothetical protein
MRVDVRIGRSLRSRRGAPQRRGNQRAVRARCSPHQFGCGDQSVAKRNLFDNVGVVARPTEPLIDNVDQADVVAAVEPGVYEVGSVDVEDHEPFGTSRGASEGMSLFHAVIMTRGCHTVHLRPRALTSRLRHG